MDTEEILRQIDVVLREVDRSSDPYQDHSLLRNSLSNLSPPESTFYNMTKSILTEPSSSKFQYDKKMEIISINKELMSVLKGLRIAYEKNLLKSIKEIIHADIYEDFLKMADSLLDEKLKDPAAMYSGIVLEEHLRKLCIKNSIQILKIDGSYKKASQLNDELKNNGIYSRIDHKNILVWQEIRNNAAHGHFDEYTSSHVEQMIQGVRNFISRYPA